MVQETARHHRRSIRLQGYDYSRAGAYFVTVCARDRACLFGDIVDGEMRLSDVGWIVAEQWIKSATIRREIELDEWVVMPNHLHGIIVITQCRGDRPVAPTKPNSVPTASGPRPKSIGALIAGFKSASTRCINAFRNAAGVPVWQR